MLTLSGQLIKAYVENPKKPEDSVKFKLSILSESPGGAPIVNNLRVNSQSYEIAKNQLGKQIQIPVSIWQLNQNGTQKNPQGFTATSASPDSIIFS
jgi:hypothetical protein